MNDNKILIESELIDYAYLFEDFDHINLTELNEMVILLNEDLLLEDLEEKISKGDQMVEKYITDYARVVDNYEKKTRMDWAIQESFRYLEVGMRIIQVLTGLSMVSKRADKMYSIGSNAVRGVQNTKRTVDNKFKPENKQKAPKTSKINKLITIVVAQILKVIAKLMKHFFRDKRFDDMNRLIATKNKLVKISKIEGLDEMERIKVTEAIKKIDVITAEYKNKYAGKV